MIKVDNRRVVSRIARQTYHANRKRNILTVLAVILTTFLIVTVLGIGIAYWQMIAERHIKLAGMDYDIELTEPTEEQVQKAKSMNQVLFAGVCVKCAVLESANGVNLSKVQLYRVDDTCWQQQCLPAFDRITGTSPEDGNDILLSEEALRDMGILEPEIGMEIETSYTPLAEESTGEVRKKTFRLCGYYRDFTGNARGYVSEEFYRTTGAKQTDFTQGTLKLTLKNPIYSRQTILSMQREFDIADKQVLIADENSIGMFVKTVLVLAGLLLMIFVSGYLFIYNTLYISVSKDIRYYGQLKTVGMTSVQLRTIIYRQALWNACIGVPIGLFAGYLVSILLIPVFLGMQNASRAQAESFSYYPVLFLLAAVFSVLTNFISCKRPAMIAAECSPVEAVRYTIGSTSVNKSENGLRAMAWRNIFRDKKKAVVVLGSFIVSTVIFFTINVVIRANDSKSILNEIYDYDIQIQNNTIPEKAEPVISEEDITKLCETSGVEAVRPLYSANIDVTYQEEVFGNFYRELYESRYAPGDYDTDISAFKKGEDAYGFFSKSKIVGISERELQLLVEDAGIDVDVEKFKNGDIALVCDWLNIHPSDAVGKEVIFSVEESGQERRMEIAGVIEDPSYFASGYTPVLVVSETYLKQLMQEPIIELVNVDYKEHLDQDTETAVKSVFGDLKNISLNSKLNRYNDMLSNEKQIRVLGNGAGLIIAVLSVLNYVNMMAASVQNRRKEFATLESIGMTAKQIHAVLVKEGLIYAVISIAISILLGIPISYVVFLSTTLYRIHYVVPIGSNLVLFAGILLVCAVIPPGIFRLTGKGSILERLR